MLVCVAALECNGMCAENAQQVFDFDFTFCKVLKNKAWLGSSVGRAAD